MEKENGGSFAVDVNENEEAEEELGGRGGSSALKDRSLAVLAGVSGGQEAGKGRVYVTGNGRNVNTDASVQPAALSKEIMLDLVAAAERSYLPGKLVDSCVISGIRGDHGGLNGFTEPEEPEEAASCPAVLGGRVSAEMGESEGETGGVTPGEELTGGGCVGVTCPGVNMPNGGVDRPYQLDHKLCSMEEVKVANGGLHIVTTARGTCDFPDYSQENSSDMNVGPGEEGVRPGYSQCPPGEDAPAPDPSEDPPTPGSSAKLPSPCPSTLSNLNSDSPPVSEPNNTREEEEEEEEEDEEDFSDLSLPVRPQSLRTNPNFTVSLSCDATPLSPDEDGGFYFGDEGVYDEDFRSVLEGGRRQSAPDKMPESSDDSDSKLMPKRFGIADFFTRSLFSRKSKEPRGTSHNATGWRLFGKTAPREEDPSKELASTLATQQVP